MKGFAAFDAVGNTQSFLSWRVDSCSSVFFGANSCLNGLPASDCSMKLKLHNWDGAGFIVFSMFHRDLGRFIRFSRRSIEGDPFKAVPNPFGARSG